MKSWLKLKHWQIASVLRISILIFLNFTLLIDTFYRHYLSSTLWFLSISLISLNSIFIARLLAQGMTKKFAKKIHRYRKKLITQSQHAALGELACQVAHDIRSPLAALAASEKELTGVPEETRTLIRNAVSRIRDIAHLLIEKNTSDSKEQRIAQPVAPMIHFMIFEKRIQLQNQPRIKMQIELAPHSDEWLVSVQSLKFKIILSNLINNSIEALDYEGKIIIRLKKTVKNEILIEIEDTGKGVPQNILHRLGRPGQTYGKPGGLGLGLYHAQSYVKKWGGMLELFSHEGEGTLIRITLPRAQAPPDFTIEPGN